jgi:hypothetical protein
MKFSLLRFTNLLLLALLVILGLTGAYGLFWIWTPWVFDLHRLAGFLLLAAVPWKVGLSAASLRRGGKSLFGVQVSLFLAGLAFGVIGLGFAWYWRLGSPDGWLGQTVISWHWMLGLALAAPLGVHVWQRWPKPHKVDFISRRAFLRLSLLAGVGLLGWGAGDWIAARRSLPQSPRRFTGSRASGDGLANAYPVTNNPGEGLQPVDLDLWRLSVAQADRTVQEYSQQDLLSLPQAQVDATVDCTLGWSSTHQWQGVPLSALFAQPESPALMGYGLLLESAAGYTHVIPFPEASAILLATHVDGQVLEPAHGYPLRAVVPTRRGWFWVKWVQRAAIIPIS